ncbi:MAG: hypothetical protein GDA42_09970 [Ekhidna sp.]|nr:hypothetical protein [Ekhidna sp.]
MSSENYDEFLNGRSHKTEAEIRPASITFDALRRYSCAGRAAKSKLTNPPFM